MDQLALLLALEQLDRADITTIHGFCRRTLRRMALSSGAAMDPELETDSTDLLQQVVQDIWRDQLLTLPADQLIGLRQSGLSPEAMVQALRVLDGEPHPCVLAERDDFDPDEPLAAQLQLWMGRCWERFLLLWQRDGDTLETRFRSSAASVEGPGLQGYQALQRQAPHGSLRRAESLDCRSERRSVDGRDSRSEISSARLLPPWMLVQYRQTLRRERSLAGGSGAAAGRWPPSGTDHLSGSGALF